METVNHHMGVLSLCSCSTKLKRVAHFERDENVPWSIEQLFRRNIKTRLSQNVANEIHDKKEEPYVQSLRILASEKIPEKFGDYHVILRI